ncbi:MAG: bifunctional phosphoribosylaminoimidazolecarboxamide formyltransferase/IMP cyclohydrolase [Thermoleophilia bacterium]
MKVNRALISVSNKWNLEEFARGLVELGVEIISTGGTARFLRERNIPITPISKVTGFPEILDGRVKTLHPKVHGGILADRNVHEHMSALQELGIEPIDMVVVNLYPFEETAEKRGVSEDDIIENIDIGGPTMVRAAAKNFYSVGVVVDPHRYDAVLTELKENEAALSLETRRQLATEAFHHTAHYDFAIAGWFSEQEQEKFPTYMMWDFKKVQDLRYGENPHQRAAFYADVDGRKHVLSQIMQLHGGELSFNNLLDLDSGRRLADEFTLPCCVIIKHNNPCGVAVSDNVTHAYEKAFSCDPVSAFGGVMVVNRPVEEDLARAMADHFVELLFAPAFTEEALEILSGRSANMRLLVDQERRRHPRGGLDLKRVIGGLLVQDPDSDSETREGCRVVSDRHPSEEEWGDLLFAWRVAKHVKSNAIVLARDLMTIGVGAGQMSRVDAAKIAVDKARHPIAGAAVASDAFLPFTDTLEVVIEAGARSMIQPGGSVRDEEVIRLANEREVAMVFTGRRHFRH